MKQMLHFILHPFSFILSSPIPEEPTVDPKPERLVSARLRHVHVVERGARHVDEVNSRDRSARAQAVGGVKHDGRHLPDTYRIRVPGINHNRRVNYDRTGEEATTFKAELMTIEITMLNQNTIPADVAMLLMPETLFVPGFMTFLRSGSSLRNARNRSRQAKGNKTAKNQLSTHKAPLSCR